MRGSNREMEWTGTSTSRTQNSGTPPSVTVTEVIVPDAGPACALIGRAYGAHRTTDLVRKGLGLGLGRGRDPPRFDPSAPGQLPGGTVPARTMRRRARDGDPDLDGADGGGIALDGQHDSEREPPIGRRVERRSRSGRSGPAPRPPGTARPSRAGGAPSFASRSPHE